MNTQNYPTWLVPLDIAKELKAIGFDKECAFLCTLSDRIGFTLEKSKGHYHYLEEVDKDNHNARGMLSVPTYEQVLAWFRARGYKIAFKDINIGTQCAFYHLDIKEGHTFSYFSKKYEKAREELVMKLIEVHKEFSNKIKRFD
nr:MAG TPA: hypothetical protein [Caudoviricetes sp.]